MRTHAVSRLLAFFAALFMGATVAFADFAEKIEGLEHKSGLIDVYLDHKEGKILLALDEAEDGSLGRYIYAPYLTAGLGSNPMGLDRSLPGGSKLLHFRRAGGRVMAVVENARFRASADNPAEKRAVGTSFPESIIWSTKVEEEEGGKVLIDFTSFLTRDAVGVTARLASGKQGNFRLDAKRSYVDTKAALAFPLNLEFDAHVTFAGSKPGGEIDSTTPEPESVSLIAHTTFMKLPDDGYQIRMSDARAGLIENSYIDMSAPLKGDVVVNQARRFRLQKDASGKVINPIVFYIDNGAPEPIRSALVEGGNWWAEAFEAAGFPGGYRVEVLPEGAHPLDARYNVVNWVHRATRGWSYGAAVHDPRTGETLRGVVLLGSLRVRQDIKIFEALAGAAKTGTGAEDDPVQLALARIRQLSAHEIGHSLGFAHNMGASTYGGRASVMDYPAPDVGLKADGSIDFSKTYGVGVGAWDMWTVNFLYGEYEGDDEKAYQKKLFADADAAGLLYVTDRDSRSIGTGHSKGGLWDNGTDPVAELQKVMAVRAAALANFGTGNLREGESYSALQTKFVPLYLYHRYQLQSAAKSIGGFDFVYRAEGDGRPSPTPVSWDKQQEALEAVLAAVTPAALDIGDDVLTALTPLADNYSDPQFRRESFANSSRPMFSHAVAAAAASDVAYNALLHPARLERLAEQGVREEGHGGLQAVLGRIVDHAMNSRGENARQQMLRAVAAERLTEKLISLNEQADLSLFVKSGVKNALNRVSTAASKWRGTLRANGETLVWRIETSYKRANTPAVKSPKGNDIPPGSPIGSASAESIYETCWHCEPVN